MPVKRIAALTALLLVVAVGQRVEAGFIVSFGFDRDSVGTTNRDGTVLDAFSNNPDAGAGTRVLLNGSTDSEIARDAFLAAIAGLLSGTEDFEGDMVDAMTGDASLEFGAMGVTALLSGGGSLQDVTLTMSSDPGDFVHRAGRYPTSGTRYWDTNTTPLSVAITSFSDPIRAFGFFITDAGDYGGEIRLQITHQTGPVEIVDIPHLSAAPGAASPPPAFNASLLYFGFLEDTDNLITGISFSNADTTFGGDRFGLDDITIATGSFEPPAVPEPSSLVLLLTGALTGAFGLRRKKRRELDVD